MAGEAAGEAFYDALQRDDPVALYERAPCGYLSTTPDGAIIKVNETFLLWSGYRREDLVGRRAFVELLTPGGRIYHETHYAPMLRMQGMAREIALDLVKADGGLLPVLVNATYEAGTDEAPGVVRVAVFDATERREYERELLRSKHRAQESEERARALAHTLQQTLIPPTTPDIPGLEVAAAYRPAGDGADVGGDFYDVFQVSQGDWVVALGDVCGKGVEAAVVTALVRYTLRAVAVSSRHPRKALASLNEVLLNHETDRFCTVVLLRLRENGDGWMVTMASAGHPLPLVARSGAQPTYLGESSPLVGVLDRPEFTDHSLRLLPGEALLLYTDGIPEARRDHEFFGDERLRELARQRTHSAQIMVDGVLAAVLDFQSGRPSDDIALVALRVPTPPGGGAAEAPVRAADPE